MPSIRVAILVAAIAANACNKDNDHVKRIDPASQPTAGEQAKLERSLDQIKREGRIVYPILKAYDWPAKNLTAYKHFLDKDKPPIPLIGYGYNTADNYVFVTREELGARTIDSLHDEAMTNLKKIVVPWDRIDANTLTASGHDFSAEKILCDDFILEAEKLIGSDEILIAVPRRRVVYAFNAKADKAARDTFSYVVAHTLDDDSYGNALITNLMFEYHGTKIATAFIVEHAGSGAARP